jgi:hypothetical protein
MRRLTSFILLGALLAPGCFAQAPAAATPAETATSSIDWAGGGIGVVITQPVDSSIPSMVRAKAEAETAVEARLPDILAGAASALVIDSSHSLGNLLDSSPALFARVSDLLLQAPREELSLSPDFSSLVLRYRVPLFGETGIVAALVPSMATPIRRLLGEVTTRRFTGVVVYAKGMLPEVGTGKMRAAHPALFPRLWDEQMNLVLAREMCSPDALVKWGMVGYAQSLDDPVVLLRAGAAPLRLAARGVFGDKDTDLLVPTSGARQLLALSENIDLLRSGRVVIVYDTLAPGATAP